MADTALKIKVDTSEIDKALEKSEELIVKSEKLEDKAHLIGMPEISVPIAVTSFSDLDAMEEAQETVFNMKRLTQQFAEMAENVFLSDELENKAEALQSLASEFAGRVVEDINKEQTEDEQTFSDKVINTVKSVFNLKQERNCKTEGGTCYPASDYAFVPDRESPSTWKLRLSQGRPGNITTTQLGRAAAAFSSGGFRGQRVQIPQADIGRVKARIRREYSKLDVDREDIPDSIKEAGFHVWKEKDGTYKWLAIYSNNIRDDDNPPEIISSQSHQRFVELVDNKEEDLPELWLWHRPEWKWGKATSIAYDDSGFSIATGEIDDNPAAKEIAEWIKEREDILVSHGMPKKSIKRNSEDKSIIDEHVTREVSPLFDWAAANKYTGFTILKESTDMDEKGIPEEKREEFIKQGVSPETLLQLEQHNQGVAKETVDLEKKEEKEIPEQEASTETESVDITEAIKSLVMVVATLQKQMETIGSEVKELRKTDGDKIAQQAALIPDASLQAYVKSALFSPDNQVAEKGPGPKQVVSIQDGSSDLFFNELGWSGGGK